MTWSKFIVFFFPIYTVNATSSDIMLLGNYTGQNVQNWVMSEKLDGIRGYWDGKQLFTRQNKVLSPPNYFIKNFPPFPIDGELFPKETILKKFHL